MQAPFKRPIPAIPQEALSKLYDGTKRVAFALAMETVEELRRNPEPLLTRAREWQKRHPLAYQPDQEMWKELLEVPVEELCRQLMRLDDRGEFLRDTMPSFGAMDEDRRLAIAQAARRAGRGIGEAD